MSKQYHKIDRGLIEVGYKINRLLWDTQFMAGRLAEIGLRTRPGFDETPILAEMRKNFTEALQSIADYEASQAEAEALEKEPA